MTELDSVVISTPAAEGEIYLQGAHVARWTPSGQRPVLFLSPKSAFAPGKAIRGGVPIVFPWFGAPPDGKPGPAHGFARTSLWTLESRDASELTFALRVEGFRLRFVVSLGAALQMSLEVVNQSEGAVRFEEALHTYLAVGDVRQVAVTGLAGATYIDKTDGFRRKVQGGEPLRITKETDSVYLNTTAPCLVSDPVCDRRLVIEKSGSASTVVWNPWIEKTARFTDMAPDDWQRMICIETANAADNAVVLAPGAMHRMTARISVV
jgi:glucose-6-phosphate 1-epimerase